MPEENELPMPELEHKKIPALTAAVRKYHEHKTARCNALTEEKAAKATLLSLMHKYEDDLAKGPDGQLYYRTGDLTAEMLRGKDKLKVEDVSDEENND